MAKVLITEQYLQDVADAIRGLNGLTTTYTPAEMAAAITGLVTGCDATAANILSGKKAMTEEGAVTGSMADMSKVQGELGGYSEEYPTLPAHKDYRGYLTSSIPTGVDETYYFMRIPTNGYYSTNTRIGIPATACGTADKSHVLSGKTFVSSITKTSSGGAVGTGTMANNGAVSKSITPSTSAQSYTIPAGYHDGGGKVTVAAAPTSLINGTATAANVLEGKTFFSDSYTAKTGTMANNGAWKSTVSFGSGTSKTVTVPAGYHNGSGNVKVNIGSQRYVDWTSDALAIRSASDPTKRIGQLIIGANGSYTYYGDRYPAHYVGASGESGFSLCWMLVALPDSYLASS